jgi:predicted Zn-dependent peptidase
VHIALGADSQEEHLITIRWSIGCHCRWRDDSRLLRVREGLAYYVRSYSEHYTDCGSFVTLAGVDAKRADEAVKVIIDECHIIASPTEHHR